MAARNLAPIRTLQREMSPIIGSFAPNGAAALDLTQRKGLGWTVSRIGAGLFKVTLTDKYADIVSSIATVQLTVAADMLAQIGPVVQSTPAVAASVSIRTLVSAVETDIAAAAGNRINFLIWVRNSAAKPTYGA